MPTFVGIKYTSGDLEKIVACVDTELAIFIGSDTILCGAFALGFDSAIATTLNIFPEIAQGIQASVEKENLTAARRYQKLLNEKVMEITSRGNCLRYKMCAKF